MLQKRSNIRNTSDLRIIKGLKKKNRFYITKSQITINVNNLLLTGPYTPLK